MSTLFASTSMEARKKNILNVFSSSDLRAEARSCFLFIFLTWSKQTEGHEAGTAWAAYHRTLRAAVLEAARSFFVEAVICSWGFGHLLHDHLRFHVLLCSSIYCDMGPLKEHENIYANTLSRTLPATYFIFKLNLLIAIFNMYFSWHMHIT